LFELLVEDNLSISFNQTHLQRIFDNTLSNAIKYSLYRKNIVVKLFFDGKFKVVEVINSGINIEHPDKLFDRFYRENDSRGGFGIGLSIIKEICDKNGVEVEVISKNELVTFRYYFV